jgi:hypothetical protein
MLRIEKDHHLSPLEIGALYVIAQRLAVLARTGRTVTAEMQKARISGLRTQQLRE